MKLDLNRIQMLEGDGTGAGGGNGDAPSWRESLPEDLKSDPTLGKYNSVEEVAKAHVELQHLMGNKRTVLPGENATEEEKSAFYNAIGRPEKPDGYTLPKFDLKEGEGLNEERTKKWLERFHKYGFTQEQTENVLKDYVSEEVAEKTRRDEQVEQARSAAEEKLKGEWKDAYSHKIEMAQIAIKKFGSEQLAADPNIANNPEVVKAFANIGKAMLEDSAQGKGSSEIVTGKTAALAEIETLQGNPEFMGQVYNRDKPGHEQAKKKWDHLFRIAYAEQKTA